MYFNQCRRASECCLSNNPFKVRMCKALHLKVCLLSDLEELPVSSVVQTIDQLFIHLVLLTNCFKLPLKYLFDSLFPVE